MYLDIMYHVLHNVLNIKELYKIRQLRCQTRQPAATTLKKHQTPPLRASGGLLWLVRDGPRPQRYVCLHTHIYRDI